MKKLIVTGDDFGLSTQVNEAIEAAHRGGALTTASLMVGAPAAEDAVRRACQLPTLRVGLHLVLVEGRPVLPAASVPGLVDGRGGFSNNLFRSGARFFFRPGVRRQLEAEIRAQFQAFRDTGLRLDHVNAHNHMHLHPTVSHLLLKVGPEFGLRAVRLPYEPPLRSWRAARRGLVGRTAAWLLLRPWIAVLGRRLRRAGIRSNQFIFGLNDSGAMETGLVLRLLERLPEGISEMYFHPAMGRTPELERAMPHYRHREEYEALISPRFKEALRSAGIQTISFADL